MTRTLLAHLRRQWIGVIALLLVLTGGTAYALDGSNTVFTDDIVNGDVKVADIGQGAVTTDELANNQVKATDIGDGEVKAAEIANGQVKTAEIGTGEVRSGNVANDNLTGGDIAGNSLKGADIDEGTLDTGDAARAYAVMDAFDCPGLSCNVSESKGVASIGRITTGYYCVIAPGINADVTPAAVSVNWAGTDVVNKGNASAMASEGAGCGPNGEGFEVRTEREPLIMFVDGEGFSRIVNGPSQPTNDVGFTIVIP